jgi:DNA repair exonuclease SbcCD ATPase subunit
MIRIAGLFYLASSALLAQPTDSQTLQALLQEMRQLRQDLNEVTIAGRRVQILLYRVQLQDDAVKKAAARQDQLNSKIKDAERNRTEAISELKEADEKLASIQNPIEREGRLAGAQELKRRVEIWMNDESGFRAAEVAAGIDLRTEQAKLLELHRRLDRLEQQLEKYALPPAAKKPGEP